MDDIDRKLLNILQKEFPLEPEPFRVVAEKFGLSEDDVLERVRKLKEGGVIRRIGAVFDPRKLGFVSTLCAARVPGDKLREFVDIVNSYAGVTHNYRRNHEYNIWFTFIAPTSEVLEKSLQEIKDRTGITDILSMPARKIFKIDASFEL
jgi:siroheme decarboxylase